MTNERPITPKRPAFFDLPAEIRLEIYAHLWGPKNVWIASPKLNSIVCASFKSSAAIRADPEALPPWLLTSKQICREALEHLRKTRDVVARTVPLRNRVDGTTLVVPVLFVPLVTTVLLGLPRGSKTRFCWHDSPAADDAHTFKPNVHPAVHGHIRFDDGARQRTFYFNLEDCHLALLQDLLERGAPIREVRAGCYYGYAFSRQHMCDKPLPEGGQWAGNPEVDLIDLKTRLLSGRRHLAELVGTEGWHVTWWAQEFGLNYESIWKQIELRWKRDLGLNLR